MSGLDVGKDACDRSHETRNCGQSCQGLRTITAMEDAVRRQECCYAIQIAFIQCREVAPDESLVSFDVLHGAGHLPHHAVARRDGPSIEPPTAGVNSADATRGWRYASRSLAIE